MEVNENLTTAIENPELAQEVDELSGNDGEIIDNQDNVSIEVTQDSKKSSGGGGAIVGIIIILLLLIIAIYYFFIRSKK